MNKVVRFLSGQTPRGLFGIGFVAVLAVGFADFLTGHEFSLFIFYLLPVAIVSSYGSVSAGLAMSLAGASMWLLTDLFEDISYSHPAVPYWNAVVRLTVLCTVVLLQNALSREKTFARTDFLSALANRKHFFETAEQEISRARRYAAPLTMVYIDIDNFKEVNDRYGHAAGDRLLQSVAGIIRGNVRAVDVPARLGGDEFAILLPQADAASARSVISKLERLLAETVRRERWPVTFSMGVVTYQGAPESVDEMVSRADALMYEAKRQGKNRILFDVDGP